MKNLCLPFSLTVALFAFLPQAWAAPVTLVSDPGALFAPTASEFAAAAAVISTLPGRPPGSVVTTLRSSPATLVNTGLDAMAPPLVLENQNNEVGVVPLPAITDNCPGNTPVTITISQWTGEQTARTFPGNGSLGGGSTMFDSRNPSFSAPVSMALISSPPDFDLPGPQIAPSASYVATLADLPFYTFGVGLDVSAVVDVAMTLEVAQASYSIDPPSITLEYDNANCGAVASSAAAVPVFSPLQLALLYTLVMIAGLVFLRRRQTTRHTH